MFKRKKTSWAPRYPKLSAAKSQGFQDPLKQTNAAKVLAWLPDPTVETSSRSNSLAWKGKESKIDATWCNHKGKSAHHMHHAPNWKWWYCTIFPRQGVHLSQNFRSSRTPYLIGSPIGGTGVGEGPGWWIPIRMQMSPITWQLNSFQQDRSPLDGNKINLAINVLLAIEAPLEIVSLHFGSGSLGCFVCARVSKVTPKKSQKWSQVLTDYYELSGIRVLLANARGAPSATAQLLLRVLKFWKLLRLAAKHLIRIQNDLMRSYEWVWEVAFSHLLMLEIEVPVQ